MEKRAADAGRGGRVVRQHDGRTNCPGCAQAFFGYAARYAMDVKHVSAETGDRIRKLLHVCFLRGVQVADITNVVGYLETHDWKSVMDVRICAFGRCENQHRISASRLHMREVANIHFGSADRIGEIAEGHVHDSKHALRYS